MDKEKKKIRLNPNPRTIRDGAVAAAIGVSLILALQPSTPKQMTSVAPDDSPWTFGSRDSGMRDVSGWQSRDGFGKLSGWGPGTGKWRYKR